ncbi:hypothetical protein ABU178_19550 [Pantoea osteomyelitidis]|uniref:Uncharacterized protein n=1 Tax=Pantoea osteomyelitidis TaxID=3230026 RepID=A0ABW7Q1I4_9GAMM
MSVNTLSWGLCAPGAVLSVRRRRTLKISETVARFNQLAVPGLGGVWFGRQLILALQGVAIATELGEQFSNIEVANAIEALSCWKGFKQPSARNGDRRLRGIRKIKSLEAGSITFRAARKKAFYVTIPMRMATLEALPALGLVQPQRSFNAFQCTPLGEQLARVEPTQRDLLTQWVKSGGGPPASLVSPLVPLPRTASRLIRTQLQYAGDEQSRQRRSAALQWVDRLRQHPPASLSWQDRPDEITPDHWHDLQAGAFFTRTRNSAIALLEIIEQEMAQRSSGPRFALNQTFSKVVQQALKTLERNARAFLELRHRDADANQFCSECSGEAVAVLRALISRDGHILQLNGEHIEPGAAYKATGLPAGRQPGEQDDLPPAADGFWPADISGRILNLFLLNLDLHGELNAWLSKAVSNG